MHHGVKGQKWGLRQWQNEDGSLTPAGREHYGYGEARSKMLSAKANYRQAQKAYSKSFNKATGASQYIRALTKKGRAENVRRSQDLVNTAKAAEKARLEYKQAKKDYKKTDEYKARQEKLKKAAIVGAALVGTALVAYGGYKLATLKSDAMKSYMAEGKRRADSIYNSNVPASTFAKESRLTGNVYYTMKNKYGETIQRGKAENWDSLAKIKEARYDAAAKERSNAMSQVRKDAKFYGSNLKNAYNYFKDRK